MGKTENYIQLEKDRNENECLFKGIAIKCKNQENCKTNTEKNHLIPKSSYLKRISSNRKVLIFDFENKDYINNGRKLLKRNIRRANTFHVLCGAHDKYLFSEIENGKVFDENNEKQLFQFALRAFIFSLSESIMKHKFQDIMKGNISNRIASTHLKINKKTLEDYKNLLQNQKWDGIESKVIKLDRKSNFISCIYIKPNYGFIFPIRFTSCNISINIFPDNNKTIIILSYLKGNIMAKAAKRYCNKMVDLAKKNEDKFVRYINKFIAAFDHNIAICPEFWENLSEKEQEDFYKVAHIFPKNKTFFSGCIGFVKLKLKKDAPKLII